MKLYRHLPQSSKDMEQNKIGGLLGICKKAGRMIVGTELTVEAIRAGKKIALVLISSDASDNTSKRIGNCCKFYNTEIAVLPFQSSALGQLIGKKGSVSVVGITDEGFADAIFKLMKG